MIRAPFTPTPQPNLNAPFTEAQKAAMGAAGGYPFPTDTQNNRTSSQGQAPKTPQSKTSLFVSNVVPAGGTLQVPVSGNTFYVSASNGVINIRPSGGVFNGYYPGTGLNLSLDNSFDLLEVNNPNTFAVAYQIFVGFDGFIDNRVYLTTQQQPQIVYPTYPTPLAANVINITDLAGSQFADINGNLWLALYRSAIIICNIDTGSTFLVQKATTAIATGPAIAAVYPLTSLRLDVQGSYRISTGGGGNINLVVSEIYTAIPKT